MTLVRLLDKYELNKKPEGRVEVVVGRLDEEEARRVVKWGFANGLLSLKQVLEADKPGFVRYKREEPDLRTPN